MHPLAVLEHLHGTEEFQAWNAEHPDTLLAHLYTDDGSTWQAGYFDKTENTITTFVLEGDSIKVIPSQEYLKTDKAIEALEVSESVIQPEQALEVAQEILNQNYHEISLKHFILLQMFEHQAIYNITFFTRTYKTLNVKVHASKNDVLSHSLSPLVDFSPEK